ncbi:anti-sigma factor [Nakamurella deserti]|uniref:anti-sigma factor n=1 Tax=Nakamurella deserti TaxID=2164074 RepID=UPI0013008FB0|nr:anti-sigma factor [Nakamurella deserti]
MRHPDPDDLALFAVSSGPDLDGLAGLGDHLTDCPACRDEVDAFRYVAALVRDDQAAEALPAPGPHVWDAIADELGLASRNGQAPAGRLTAVPDAPTAATPDARITAGADASTPTGQDARTSAAREAAAPGAPAPSGPAPTAPVTHPQPHQGSGIVPPTELDERRRRRARWLPAAAALVVGAALGAGAIAVTRDTRQPDPTEVRATAALDVLPDAPVALPEPTAGQAELVTVDGAQRVVVNAPELPAIPGAYEVWLFGADGKMVSLGSLHAGRGDFTVPQGIDTAEYRTVDISDEPADGVPTHSGVSIVRGTFS